VSRDIACRTHRRAYLRIAEGLELLRDGFARLERVLVAKASAP